MDTSNQPQNGGSSQDNAPPAKKPYEPSKSSKKLKKFDGRYICKFCEKDYQYPEVIGKHQRGVHKVTKCKKMQEGDEYDPKNVIERRWRRDENGKALGPEDPSIYQVLRDEVAAERQTYADLQALAVAAGAAAADVESGDSTEMDTATAALGDSRVATPDQDADMVEPEQQTVNEDGVLPDQKFLTREAAEEAAETAEPTTQTNATHDADEANIQINTMPPASSLHTGRGQLPDTPQWSTMRDRHEDDDDEDASMADPDITSSEDCDTEHLQHEGGSAGVDTQSNTMEVPSAVNETALQDDLALITRRISNMPIVDPTWDAKLGVFGMPWEVRGKIFEYAVAPSQHVLSNPLANGDRDAISKYGKFALQLRFVNHEANVRVMEALVRKVPWVKLVIQHTLAASRAIWKLLGYLRNKQLFVRDNAFRGVLSPFLTLSICHDTSSTDDQPLVSSSMLVAYSTQTFVHLCLKLAGVYSNDPTTGPLKIIYLHHHIVHDPAMEVFGTLRLLHGIQQVDVQGDLSTEARQHVQNMMQEVTSLLEFVCKMMRRYLGRAKADCEAGMHARALVQSEAGMLVMEAFRGRWESALNDNSDLQPTSNLIHDLRAQLNWRSCVTINAAFEACRLNGSLNGIEDHLLDSAVKHGFASLAFAGTEDWDRGRNHYEVGVALCNRGIFKEYFQEYEVMEELYHDAAKEIYYASLLQPGDATISGLLEELEDRIGEKMEGQCSVVDIFDQSAGMHWKGALRQLQEWQIPGWDLTGLALSRERPGEEEDEVLHDVIKDLTVL